MIKIENMEENLMAQNIFKTYSDKHAKLKPLFHFDTKF